MWQEPSIDAAVPRQVRTPASTWLAAGIAGILVDRVGGPPFSVWLGLISLAVLCLLFSRNQTRLSTGGLLLGWVAAFGAWHHDWAADPPPGNVYHWSTPDGRLMTVSGRVITPSWIRERPDQEALLNFDLECVRYVNSSDEPVATTGRVRVQVPLAQQDVNRQRFAAGDLVTLTGRLIRPPRAGNPEDFDYRDWLRSQGIEALFRVRRLAAIESGGSAPTLGDQLTNWRERLRDRAIGRLQSGLSSRQASVAEALLLGTRARMPSDVRDAFLASGMLHMLAISGVNVSVIWWMLMRAGRAARLSYPTCGWLVIIGMLGYAWLTEANPPIVRAALCACVFQLAALSGRRVALVQTMALAAIAILALNPANLFNAGAWLSFLSVSVLVVAGRWFETRWQLWQDEFLLPRADSRQGFAGLAWPERGRQAGVWFLRTLMQSTVMTTAIWLVTAPLVASRFHLLSLVGIGLNAVVGPCFVILLWLGYLWLALAMLVPGLSDLVLTPFAVVLQALLWITEWGRQQTYGAAYVPGWPDWWLAGFYLGIFGLLVPPVWWTRRLQWQAGSAWIVLGLIAGSLPQKPAGLVCDIVSVGHGLAVVCQAPSGRTLVYDTGSLAGGDIAAEAVSRNLWQSGQHRIDALIVSHADADHCNGIPGLTQRLQTGTLLTHPTFINAGSLTVRSVLQAWQATGGVHHLIAAGDIVDWDDDVRLEVWLPDKTTDYTRDNANSLVVLLEYAGRKILLTGDLEREGLRDLLNRPRTPVVVLIAPHHGSPAANPPELGAWAHPQFAVFSAADTGLDEKLDLRYPPDTVLLNTAISGRIRFVIRPDGELQLQRYRTDFEG